MVEGTFIILNIRLLFVGIIFDLMGSTLQVVTTWKLTTPDTDACVLATKIFSIFKVFYRYSQPTFLMETFSFIIEVTVRHT